MERDFCSHVALDTFNGMRVFVNTTPPTSHLSRERDSKGLQIFFDDAEIFHFVIDCFSKLRVSLLSESID